MFLDFNAELFPYKKLELASIGFGLASLIFFRKIENLVLTFKIRNVEINLINQADDQHSYDLPITSTSQYFSKICTLQFIAEFIKPSHKITIYLKFKLKVKKKAHKKLLQLVARLHKLQAF